MSGYNSLGYDKLLEVAINNPDLAGDYVRLSMDFERLTAEHAQMMLDVKASASFVKRLLEELRLLELFTRLKDEKWSDLGFFQKAGIIKSVVGGVQDVFTMSEGEMDEIFPKGTLEVVERFIKHAEVKNDEQA